MSIRNRPYAGSWDLGKQTMVRHTPDSIVLINGHSEMAVCATCGHKLDFNRYITSVSVEAMTDPGASASISLAVPRHDADVFSHDGNYVLHPGLEVVVLMRGYFPDDSYAATGQDQGSDDPNTKVYPYYQVFRGVVTEASHEFSGGFYTASLSCSSILHFWQYLYLNTNGAALASAPKGGGNAVNFLGHALTGMTPYEIIYTLVRVGFGAAFGVNWTIQQSTNLSAVDEETGKSLYKHAALWWEKRWQESTTRLRMYGMDGSLFNAMEQAYLGAYTSKKAKGLLKSYGIKAKGGRYKFATKRAREIAREFGYRAADTQGAVLDTDGATLDVLKMQAFTMDMGSIGNVNLFDSAYMSKLEVANTVKELTGFEFYQDVDGDIVFKPPYYNLDTTSDPVYIIEDRDLISISESEREPEATYVKGSGSLFQNFTGILSGEFGTREGKFVDWRLVSQYGWREASFESQYYSGGLQMFIGAVMRLDVSNVEMRSAQITIPLRPELRPGYPVYVKHLDCFFYIRSLSHSFAPGGACQTTITGCAKRPKFLAPGLPPRTGLPTLADVRLDDPGSYPPMPLYVEPKNLPGAADESSGPPRIQGYPNVVLALDPSKVNSASLSGGLYFTSGQTFFDTALSTGALRRVPDNPDEYILSEGNDDTSSLRVSKGEVLNAYSNYSQALSGISGVVTDAKREAALKQLTDSNSKLGNIIAKVEEQFALAIPDQQMLGNYMRLQNNLKAVYGDDSVQGRFRYFSSSSPNTEDQGPVELYIDHETGTVDEQETGAPANTNYQKINVLRDEGGEIAVKQELPTQGFRVYGLKNPGEGGGGYVDVTTRDIRMVNFQRIVERVSVTIRDPAAAQSRSNLLPTAKDVRVLMESALLRYAASQDPNQDASLVFGDGTLEGGYGAIVYALDGLVYISPEADTASSKGVRGDLRDDGIYSSFPRLSRPVSVRSSVTKYYDTVTGQECSLSAIFVDPTCADTENPARAETTSVTTRSRKLLPETGTVTEITGNADATAAIKVIAVASAKSLSAWYARMVKAYVKAGTEITTSQREIAATFIKELAALSQRVVKMPKSVPLEISTAKYEEKEGHSLVLPVSDNAGYEVYGTMPYGRGLKISQYQQLLAQRGSPTSTVSLSAFEAYYAQLIASNNDVSKALDALDDEQKAILARDVGTTPDSPQLATQLEKIKSDDTSPQVYIRNAPLTTYSRGQSVTGQVAAEELSRITGDAGTPICVCKGVEASHFLQAFTGQFVALGDDAVNAFLTQEATEAGRDYQMTKQALQGETLDLSSGNKLSELGRNLQSAVDQGVGALRSAGEDAAVRIQEAADDVRLSAQVADEEFTRAELEFEGVPPDRVEEVLQEKRRSFNEEQAERDAERRREARRRTDFYFGTSDTEDE